MGSLRGASPSLSNFPLSFILPRKERGIQGVRLRNIEKAALFLRANRAKIVGAAPKQQILPMLNGCTDRRN
jgi:hypothetical protein